ncbi:MarR family transcriptional regulator [Streptomyces sp. NPDC006430]|uniref:MarR family winged helix-turn-helix transcriptional regulator n=1 Tax=Streptomyces sp. NPDC006430 TaxID=3154299 RepID=UPI0033B3673A
MESNSETDQMDRILAQWQAEEPDLDVTPMGIVGRLQRASRLLERSISDCFAEHDLQLWEFDIIATLLRSGPPYRLTVGALGETAMVTSGAITNRLDRLATRGLIDRQTDPSNRRSVLITLTDTGRALVRPALLDHLQNEARLLSSLDTAEQDQLGHLLRKLLLDLGDRPVQP